MGNVPHFSILFDLCLVAAVSAQDQAGLYDNGKGLVEYLTDYMISLRDCGCNMDGLENKLFDDAGQCISICNVPQSFIIFVQNPLLAVMY